MTSHRECTWIKTRKRKERGEERKGAVQGLMAFKEIRQSQKKGQS